MRLELHEIESRQAKEMSRQAEKIWHVSLFKGDFVYGSMDYEKGVWFLKCIHFLPFGPPHNLHLVILKILEEYIVSFMSSDTIVTTDVG